MLGSLKSRLVVRVYLAFGAVVVGLTLTTTMLQVFSAIRAGASEAIIAEMIRIAVAGLGLALVLGFILAKRLAQPLADLIRVATAMRRGRYEERVAPIDVVELSSIGEALNVLGEEVSSRIALMSRDRAQLRSILSAMVEGIIAIDNAGRILFSNQAASRLLHSDMRLSRGEDFKNVPAVNLLADLINDARDFVANVSHELKTPLTAIKGYVEALLGGAMEDPVTNVRFLEKIDRNVGRLSNLVQDILSLARIESHEDVDLGDAASVRIDWRSIVQAVASAHEDEAAAKGITMSVKLSDEPLVVAGEREAMRQILDNLVSNAIKYTPKSGQVWIDGHKSAGSECEIVVRDSGIGIPEKHLDRIFERFYRVDVARSREMGGTGLGLSIVKHLVAGLGGQVTVESKVGAGSAFTVHMKLASRQQEES